MSLPVPFVMCLPGRKDKSREHEKQKGAAVCSGYWRFELLVTRLERNAGRTEQNAGVERQRQARREAEA